VYDTTLQVPLVLAGPGLQPRTVDGPVNLIDVAPTVLSLLGVPGIDGDGIDLGPAVSGSTLPDRTLYAESYAPQLDFGWSALRTVRTAGWKYIAAPTPELYEVSTDAGELRNVASSERTRATAMRAMVDRFGPAALARRAPADREAAARLQALGYVSSSASGGGSRPDPKDKGEQAARLARVTSGELHGPALEQALRDILDEEPGNPVANLRLGYALVESGNCRDATRRFEAAIAAGYPSADPYLGLAGCQAGRRAYAAAAATLRSADGVEPGNPVVLANLGLVLSDGDRFGEAVAPLEQAIAIDPDLHRARFALAIAYAESGRRGDAAAQAEELLRRLPPAAPQRPEIERLLAAVR